ncbi:hypothetical protein WISP_106522 [Willisornis vidua]|uniref:ribonuclease H n=1 Tax=Willisornis vidua TaxID=1566151 RepID=A0ABQ9D2R8_9PASS|nr:hypothetical protein WISP_106522 [Willisornis vidua]
MKNNPTICQAVVSRILGPVRLKYPEAIIYHYMDDILLAAQNAEKLKKVHNEVITILKVSGLEIASEKTQVTAPWQYLALLLSSQTFVPQKVEIVKEVKTLNQLQALLGNINWVRSHLGLSTDFLAPLFQLLKGDTDLSSPRVLTPEAQSVLENINYRISSCQVRRMKPGLPSALIIFKGQ